MEPLLTPAISFWIFSSLVSPMLRTDNDAITVATSTSRSILQVIMALLCLSASISDAVLSFYNYYFAMYTSMNITISNWYSQSQRYKVKHRLYGFWFFHTWRSSQTWNWLYLKFTNTRTGGYSLWCSGSQRDEFEFSQPEMLTHQNEASVCFWVVFEGARGKNNCTIKSFKSRVISAEWVNLTFVLYKCGSCYM